MNTKLTTLIAILLTLCSARAATVLLAWDANTETNIAGYKLLWGPASRTYPFTNDVGNRLAGGASNLLASGRYFFAATAYTTNTATNGSVYLLESDYSLEVTALTPVPVPPGVSVTNATTNSLTVVWGAPATNIVRYTLLVATNVAGPYATNSTTNTSFTASGLVPGRTYFFTLSASNVFGVQSAGVPVSGSTLLPPQPPAGFRIMTILEASTTGITPTNWAAVSTNLLLAPPDVDVATIRARLQISPLEPISQLVRAPVTPPPLPPSP